MPWANGGGTTAEVLVHPVGTESWDWRLSLADVASDGPFSALPGIDRLILVAEGAGMHLTVGSTTHRLTTDDDAFAFDGGADTTCRLVDGAITDLNLMLRRGHAAGRLHRVVLTAGESLHLAPDTVAIVVLEGTLRWQHHVLDRFDVLVLESHSPSVALTADTAASVVTVVAHTPADRFGPPPR